MGLAVAVGTAVTRCPPHGSVRALISAYGSCRGCLAAKRHAAHRTPINPWDTRFPHCVGHVWDGWAFSLTSGLPSALSADDLRSLFECFIGTTPLSDSSKTCMQAVRLSPFPADRPRYTVAGAPEVSRFSCRKCLGVLWGLRLRRADPGLALAPRVMLPSAELRTSAP